MRCSPFRNRQLILVADMMATRWPGGGTPLDYLQLPLAEWMQLQQILTVAVTKENSMKRKAAAGWNTTPESPFRNWAPQGRPI